MSSHRRFKLTDTYWYVPAEYLAAMLAINGSEPRIVKVTDQTVWHIVEHRDGYVAGISATNIGHGWGYMLIAGSVTPEGSVKLSFSPLGAANPDDPTTQAMTIGDGVLRGGDAPQFVMQMTSGNASSSVTHWAHMLPVTADDPAWTSLPGYPDTGVADLTGLQTSIQINT